MTERRQLNRRGVLRLPSLYGSPVGRLTPRGRTPGFILPSAVTGLQGWWKADAGVFSDVGGTTPSVADGVVARWNDQSGNGRYFRTATPPTLKTGASGINSLPVVRFDNVDDTMSSAAASWTLTNIITASEFCLYAVVRPNTPDTNSANTYLNDGIIADSGQIWGLHLKSTGPTFQGYNWDGSDDHVDAAFAAGTAYAVRYRHTGGNITLLRSGLSVASAASGNTTSLTGSVNLGRAGGLQFFDGDIAEFFVYNAQPSAGELTGLAAYITSRYAIVW